MSTAVDFTRLAQRLQDKILYLEPGSDVLLTGAGVIDGSGAPRRERQSLLVTGDRIAYIGPDDGLSLPLTPHLRTIDCTGLTLIPGLIDSHVHFTGQDEKNAFERYAPSTRQPYRTISAAVDAMRVLDAGFTTVRDLGHGLPEQAFAIRQAVEDRLIPGPRTLASGFAISQSGGHGDPHIFPHDVTVQYRPRSTFADGPYECRKAVRLNLGAGADCIKIFVTEGSLVAAAVSGRVHTNFTVEEIAAMVDEAHRRGVRVAAHATSLAGVENAISGGVDTIEHGGPLGDAPQLLDEMARKGIHLVPTLKVYETIATEGARWGVHPQGILIAAQLLAHAKGYIKSAWERGIQIAVGTDMSWFDRGDNARELGLLVEAGLSPLEAIQAATRVSAAALGLEKDLGTLEVNKIGEMLVLEDDPSIDVGVLRDPQRIRLILKSGAPLRTN
jgi:imidazolonepropionase-like amidohydrolase